MRDETKGVKTRLANLFGCKIANWSALNKMHAPYNGRTYITVPRILPSIHESLFFPVNSHMQAVDDRRVTDLTARRTSQLPRVHPVDASCPRRSIPGLGEPPDVALTTSKPLGVGDLSDGGGQ